MGSQKIELEQMTVKRGDGQDEDYILLTLSRATSRKKLTGFVDSMRGVKGIKEISFQADKSLQDH